jgi:hypothetical protein
VALLALVDSFPTDGADAAEPEDVDPAAFEAAWLGREPFDPAAPPDIDAYWTLTIEPGHARRFRALAMQGTTLRRAHRPGRFDGSAMLFVATQEGQAGVCRSALGAAHHRPRLDLAD